MGSGSSSNTSSSSESDDESSEYDNLNEETKDTTEPPGDVDGDVSDLDLNHLFDHGLLRDAAAKIKDDIPETVVQQHHGHLLRWLEERLQRHEATISLSQFCDVLMNRAVGREECVQAFDQFDVDGEGQADVEAMLDALKSSNGANLKGELSHVIRSLQACSLTPGLLDVYSTEQVRVPQHGKRIMKYLLRNRAPSTSLPFATLDGFNNSTGMRLTVLKHHFEIRQKQSVRRETADTEGGEVKVITKCYKTILCSTNNRHVQRLTDGDSSSFWQSDGAARSHWVRLRLKSGVSLKHLSITVARQDQSYMPQHVTVSTGRSLSSMQEIKDIRIPNHITGDVVLIDNVHITNPYIQINIRRCHSDGCDVRIHGVKAQGSRVVQPSEIGVKDASAVWYLSVLASTATAAIPTAPHLRHAILKHTKTALSHMPPLSLSHASCSRHSFLSPHVLDEMETFLNSVARDECGNVELEGTQILLELALARGSCLSVLKALQSMQAHLGKQLSTSHVLKSLETVTDKILKRYGSVMSLSLAGCDGGQKDDTSVPENVLSDNWNTQVYNSSKTLVNMFFTKDTPFQMTKVRIKVSRGGNGAKCGFIFVYNDEAGFELERHVNRFKEYDTWTGPQYNLMQGLRFKEYDTWTGPQYNLMQGLRAASIGGNPDNPVAYFTLEDDWDEIEAVLDRCYVGKYMLVKFLRPRKDTVESMGIVGIKCYGYSRQLSPIDIIELSSVCALPLHRDDLVHLPVTFTRVVHFLVHMARDMDVIRRHDSSGRCPSLDLQDISLELMKQVYDAVPTSDDEWIHARVLMLQLLHYSFPALVRQIEKSNKIAEKQAIGANSQQETQHDKVIKEKSRCTQELFVHLCDIVNTLTPAGDEAKGMTGNHPTRLLLHAAQLAILDGAAVFFPDKQARKQELFNMMNTVASDGQSAGGLVFQSLCRFYSAVDPSGLLDLPTSTTSTGEFESTQVLSVMETMLNVVFTEFEKRLSGGTSPNSVPSSCSYICNLLCSLQTSLMLWCRQLLQESAPKPEHIQLAGDLLVKYASLHCTKTQEALSLLCKHHKDCDIMVQMAYSFVATAFRQMVLCLTLLSKEKLPYLELAQQLMQVYKQVGQLEKTMGDDFYQVYKQVGQLEQTMGDDFYQGGARPSGSEKELVVLRTWNVESSHNYENNQHVTQIFTCPGAELFYLEFDPRCDTERRYDYLEFTDSRGVKTRYDQKVGTDKWPTSVTFKSGHRLQFLFHSDSSNNEWGYKFTVTAKGSPDVSLSWLYDLQLSVAKVMGQMLSSALNPKLESSTKPPSSTGDNETTEQESLAVLAKGELWNTLFRSGRSTKKFTRSLSGIHAAEPTDSSLHDFLVNVSEGEPGKATRFITRCREHCQAPSVGGAIVNSAINSVFAALLWHSQQLRDEVNSYLRSPEDAPLSDGMIQAFRTAEGLRPIMIDLRQKQMASQEKAAKLAEAKKDKQEPTSEQELDGEKDSEKNSEKDGERDSEKDGQKDSEKVVEKDGEMGGVKDSKKDGTKESAKVDEKDSEMGGEKDGKKDGEMGCEKDGEKDNEKDVEKDGEKDRQAAKDGEKSDETAENETDSKLIGCRDKARFLLTFAGLSKPEKSEKPGRHWLIRSRSHFSRTSQEMLQSQKSLDHSVPFQGTAEEGSILSTFPEFKLVLDYVKNPHLTIDSVLDLLSERQKTASLIADVFHFASEFLVCSDNPQIFQPVCVQFLREMLSCSFVTPMHYASGLDGCGLELENKLRKAYYMLVHRVVEAVNKFTEGDLQAYECIQACLLHLLDIDWQPYDWQFLDEIEAPSLLMSIAKNSVSLRDRSVSDTSTEKQLEVYKQCQEWLKKCEGENKFSNWFDAINKATMEQRRAMHMFVARFCDQLDVQIKCDGCGTMLPGQRYRCLVCEDMDFCYPCYIGGVKPEGHRDEHALVHLMYKCDSCHAFIVGTRVHCNVCEDFDLCYGCHHINKYPSCHKSYHDTETIPMTTVTAGSMSSGMLKTYNHHHAWLLFASFALSFASAVNQPRKHDINSGYIEVAMKLQQQSLDLVTDCLQLLSVIDQSDEKDLASTSEDKDKQSKDELKKDKEDAPKKDESKDIKEDSDAQGTADDAKVAAEKDELKTAKDDKEELTEKTQESAEEGKSKEGAASSEPKKGEDAVESTTKMASKVDVQSQDTGGDLQGKSKDDADESGSKKEEAASGLEPAADEDDDAGSSLKEKAAASADGTESKSQESKDETSGDKEKETQAAGQDVTDSVVKKEGDESAIKGKEDEEKIVETPQVILPSIDTFNKAFVECSQERILGLLASMLLIDNVPKQPLSSPSRKAKVHGEKFLPLLLSLTKQVKGQRNEPQHLAVALLGQVLCQSEPKEADLALIQASSESDQTSGEAAAIIEELQAQNADGNNTATLLFSLGATCLERSGMDWAALMADVLQRLWACPSWQSVIAGHVSHMVQSLPDNFNQLPAIFALFVLAGFPEVLSLGSSVLYSEPSGDQSNIIVIKHYMEKSRAVVVDIKSRKRKLVKEYQLEVQEKCGQTLSTEHFVSFVSIAVRILTDLKAGKEQTVEALWVLYLTLKALTTSLKNDASNGQQILASGIIPLLVFMASKATQLSRQWILKDLEILSIKLYTRDKTFSRTPPKPKKSKSADLDDSGSDSDSLPWSDADSVTVESSSTYDEDSDDSGSGYLTPDSGPSRPPPPPVPPEVPKSPQGQDPLDGLDDKAKTCLVVTNEAIRAPMSILRAMYEQCGGSIKELVEEVQNCYQGDELVVSDEIRARARQWEPKSAAVETPVEETESKAVDSGAVSLVLIKPTQQPSSKELIAIPEPTDGPLKLIASSENDLKESYKKVQRSKSVELLKKELNAQGKTGSRDYLVKINSAMAILRSRHLLAILLADWPKDAAKISAGIFGCTEHSELVSILDLLQKSVSKDVFQKVVETVVWHCEIDLLAPFSTSAVSFMQESSFNVQTKESEHRYKNDTKDEGRVCIPGATHLTIKFDDRCSTEEGCDVLTVSSDQPQKHDRHVFSGPSNNWVDFEIPDQPQTHDRHVFSGPSNNWVDFEIPGDTMYYTFVSDSSNNDWGYKFTVIGNQLGRFETGYVIMSTILSHPTLHQKIPIDELWKWLIQVACQQTSQHRLKVLQLLLQMLHIEARQQITALATAGAAASTMPTNGIVHPDLTLLKPLWLLLNKMDNQQSSDSAPKCLPAVHRALTELFLLAENQAQDWNIHEDYMIAMIDEQELKQVAAQALRNIAAIGLALNIPNKASDAFKEMGLIRKAYPMPTFSLGTFYIN